MPPIAVNAVNMMTSCNRVRPTASIFIGGRVLRFMGNCQKCPLAVSDSKRAKLYSRKKLYRMQKTGKKRKTPPDRVGGVKSSLQTDCHKIRNQTQPYLE
jgi:hypothetical protein